MLLRYALALVFICALFAPFTPATAHATSTTSATLGVRVAQHALQFVGAPYVYGGASPRGFDCSGLTSYVYRQLGIKLPRSSRAQFASAPGQRIRSIAALQPGDLVFFANTAGRGISHVALYVGNDMMVSANTPRMGVQYVAITSAYWRKHFVGGIRPAADAPEPSGPQMPNLVGLSEAEAKAALARVGITQVVVDYQGLDHLGERYVAVAPDTVVSHSVAAGTPITAATTVVLGVRAP